MNFKPVILTSGDPSSIASFITLKAFQKIINNQENTHFIVVSNTELIKCAASYYDIKVPIENITNIQDTPYYFKNKTLPVFNIPLSSNPILGEITNTKANAQFSLNSIDISMQFVLDGLSCGLCTNPINKDIINSYLLEQSHQEFLGHTQYIFDADPKKITLHPIMMLCDPTTNFKVVPLTTHIPLQKVTSSINQEIIVTTVTNISSYLQNTWHITNPKILVTGLNPHSGENGLLGNEEIDIIIPALEILRSKGINCTGPIAADTAFIPFYLESHDIIVGMYHDQVLAPFKTLSFINGINTTIGLSYIRTSVDHGTAYALAKNKKPDISSDSLFQALKLAYKLGNNNG